MRIIKIKSCKTCPYRRVGHSFKDGMWTLKCGKLYDTDFNIVSIAKYEKKLLNYTIPNECPLEEIVDIPGRR